MFPLTCPSDEVDSVLQPEFLVLLGAERLGLRFKGTGSQQAIVRELLNGSGTKAEAAKASSCIIRGVQEISLLLATQASANVYEVDDIGRGCKEIDAMLQVQILEELADGCRTDSHFLRSDEGQRLLRPLVEQVGLDYFMGSVNVIIPSTSLTLQRVVSWLQKQLLRQDFHYASRGILRGMNHIITQTAVMLESMTMLSEVNMPLTRLEGQLTLELPTLTTSFNAVREKKTKAGGKKDSQSETKKTTSKSQGEKAWKAKNAGYCFWACNRNFCKNAQKGKCSLFPCNARSDFQTFFQIVNPKIPSKHLSFGITGSRPCRRFPR